jgi:hypothetical protein
MAYVAAFLYFHIELLTLQGLYSDFHLSPSVFVYMLVYEPLLFAARVFVFGFL